MLTHFLVMELLHIQKWTNPLEGFFFLCWYFSDLVILAQETDGVFVQVFFCTSEDTENNENGMVIYQDVRSRSGMIVLLSFAYRRSINYAIFVPDRTKTILLNMSLIAFKHGCLGSFFLVPSFQS